VETIRNSQNGLAIIVSLAIAIGLTFYLLRRRRRKLLKEADKDASSEDAENTSKNDRIVA
jgi:LPXTG-motif cell wall-anchored protein